MKKISLNGVSHILSEKELKNVMGGSFPSCDDTWISCYTGNLCIKQDTGATGVCIRSAGTCTCE